MDKLWGYEAHRWLVSRIRVDTWPLSPDAIIPGRCPEEKISGNLIQSAMIRSAAGINGATVWNKLTRRSDLTRRLQVHRPVKDDFNMKTLVAAKKSWKMSAFYFKWTLAPWSRDGRIGESLIRQLNVQPLGKKRREKCQQPHSVR